MIREGTVRPTGAATEAVIEQRTPEAILGMPERDDSILDEDFGEQPEEPQPDLPGKSLEAAPPAPAVPPTAPLAPPAAPPAPAAPEVPQEPAEPEKPWDESDGAFFARIGFQEIGRYRGTKHPRAWDLDDQSASNVGGRLAAVINKHGIQTQYKDEIKLAVAVYVTYRLCCDAEQDAAQAQRRPQIPQQPAAQQAPQAQPQQPAAPPVNGTNGAAAHGTIDPNEALARFKALLLSATK